MKIFNVLLVLFLVICSCQGQERKKPLEKNEDIAVEFSSFGEQINVKGSISNEEMTQKYKVLSVPDTLRTKFAATVTEVCQAKGCWMKLQLKGGQETMVSFKDYGFFMPKDIAGREVVVDGSAFVSQMSVEDQRHYAKDGGKSQEEIDKIAESKKTYGFVADGVLLRQ